MKNICLIDYDMSVFGGAERVATTLANSLASYFNVFVVSLNNENGKPAFLLDERIKYTAILSGKHRIRQLLVRGTGPLRKFLKENKIDVALSIGTGPMFYFTLATRFLKIKTIFCDHGALENQLNERVPKAQRYLGAKFSDKIVTLTEYNMNSYKKRYRTSDKRISYIYNCIDDKLLQNDGEYNKFSKQIISVGRMTPEKGYDMLVDIGEMVFLKHPDWQWHIFGDGEDLEKTKQEVVKRNLDKNIIFKGNVTDIYDRYKDYSLLVLPSYREGLPLVLLEAKANNLPIVSFNVITGPSEIVRDNVDGFLVEMYDKEKMAEKICLLIENEDLRIEMSSNSKGNLNKFSKENITKKWVELIQNI